MKFALDTPNGSEIPRAVRFSGWCLNEAGLPADALELRVDGVAVAQLERTPRWDLASAFPLLPEAVLGGFVGDLVVPEHVRAGNRIDVEIFARSSHARQVVLQRRYTVTEEVAVKRPRIRSFELAKVLQCVPDTDAWSALANGSHSATWAGTVLGVPHFHNAGTMPSVRVLESGPTNPYSAGAWAVMDGVPADGVFLDLGCGIRRQQDVRTNGLYLDAVHFRGVDVVNTCSRLPLRDACLDAVVSLAVFEHVPEPFAMAAEIRRVLKPGGTVWIETAFMQPMHADPSHYFNMTGEGLMRVFSDFEIAECGVLPHQMPSHALSMQLEHALPYMHEGAWKRSLDALLAQLRADGAALDAALGPIGRRKLAAGVYLRGQRPAYG